MSEQTYWEERDVFTQGDWGTKEKFLESYRSSVNHPHRELIIDSLKELSALI